MCVDGDWHIQSKQHKQVHKTSPQNNWTYRVSSLVSSPRLLTVPVNWLSGISLSVRVNIG